MFFNSTAAAAAVLLFVNMFMVNNAVSTSAAAANPLTAEWTGPYGGIPPFDKVKVADFKPAIEAGMAERLAEIDKITSNPEPATFDNTIVALERSGSMFDRVMTVYGIWGGNMATPDYQVVQREMAPRLAAFNDKITQNEALFKRIEAVYNSPEKAKFSAERQRLVWVYYTNFVRSGAKLDAAKKNRLGEINQALAGLFTKFGQNLLAEENWQWVVLETEADLAGLSQSLKDAAAAAAVAKKVDSAAGIILNTRSSVDPFLTDSTRRDLREKVWKMFINRGDNANQYDNNASVAEILQLRAERANLLGYKTHAHWRLENAMAKTPERTLELMETVWPAAIARVKEEVADMQALADKDGAKITIEPWDYRFYMEKVRKAKFDLDQNEVKPYLQLDKIRDAMFFVAGEIFNFSFTPVTDVPVFHPDVMVWEVKDKTTGKHVGLWYFDPYARDGKRSGAWMNAYRSQERMDKEITTIVSNNSNFVKGAATFLRSLREGMDRAERG